MIVLNKSDNLDILTYQFVSKNLEQKKKYIEFFEENRC